MKEVTMDPIAKLRLAEAAFLLTLDFSRPSWPDMGLVVADQISVMAMCRQMVAASFIERRDFVNDPYSLLSDSMVAFLDSSDADRLRIRRWLCIHYSVSDAWLQIVKPYDRYFFSLARRMSWGEEPSGLKDSTRQKVIAYREASSATEVVYDIESTKWQDPSAWDLNLCKLLAYNADEYYPLLSAAGARSPRAKCFHFYVKAVEVVERVKFLEFAQGLVASAPSGDLETLRSDCQFHEADLALPPLDELDGHRFEPCW